MKIFYLDVETTGLDEKKNDIIQLAGIVEIDSEVMESFKLVCQPFDYEAVEPSALEVHGMTIDQIKEFPTPQEAYKALIKILSKYIDRYDKFDKFTPAGQNVPFDTGFLKQFFLKNGDVYYGSWFNYQHVDLMSFSLVLKHAGLLKIDNVKLATVAEKFGVPLQAHDALEDIQATRNLLKIMIKKYLGVEV